MVKIRLRRKGRIHHPVYDIVAVDVRAKRDGAFLERLGYYDPNVQPSKISVDPERAIYWLNNGAQPTERVKLLLSYEGVLLRRNLQLKNKTTEEIEAALVQHKEIAKARYKRLKERRKQRDMKKSEKSEETKEESSEG